MDLIDQLQSLASRVSKNLSMLATEEATKNALVMPFINALGYNVFDPHEVTPELVADVGVKKGEKVDYAILKDGQVVMLFECKSVSTNLDRITPSQLYRYFSVTRARVGILTNGILYRFFSDLDAPNKMDNKPFLEFNLLDIQEPVVAELKKLTKGSFDEAAILEAASELKYTREMKRVLLEQLATPSDDFVKLLVAGVYEGRMTQAVRDQFKPIVQRAFRLFVHDQINGRLKSALAQDPTETVEQTVEAGEEQRQDQIVTLEEERESFYLVKAILREVIDPKRVVARDVKTYFGVLLDDNNRKPLCRLYFNTGQAYIGLFDKGKQAEERMPIANVDEIYRFADRLKATVLLYEGAPAGLEG